MRREAAMNRKLKIGALLVAFSALTAVLPQGGIKTARAFTEATAATSKMETKNSTIDEYQGCSPNNQRISGPEGGGYVRLDNIDFGQGKLYDSVSVWIGVPDEYAGGSVTYYLDTLDFDPIATMSVKSSGGWENFVEQTAVLSNPRISGIHSVYLKFGRVGNGDITHMRFNASKGSGIALPEDLAESEFAESAKKLVSLGVYEINPDVKFEPETEITGSELAECALMLQDKRSDTELDAVLSELKISADGNVTASTAAKMFLHIAGYTPAMRAKAYMGSDVNYILEAKNVGIFKGLAIDYEAAITRGTMLRLMENTLDVEYIDMGERSTGSTQYVKTKGLTVLARFYGIYSYEGIVTANEETSLVIANGVGEGNVKINTLVYDAGETDIGDYLGYNVKYYYEYNDCVIKYFAPEDTTVLSVGDADVISYANGKLTYVGDKDRTSKKSFSMSPERFDVIYNGIAKSDYDESLLTDFNGTLTAIDNDRDGVYEVILIDDYYNIIVGAVSNGKIYSKFDNRIVDYEKDNVTTVNAAGRELTEAGYEALAEWTVLSVREAKDAMDRTVYKINVSSLVERGTIAKVDEDVITIGETEYTLSKLVQYETGSNILKLGSDVILSIDALGEVAAVRFYVTDALYGYVVSLKECEEEDTTAVLRIFNEEGEMLKIYSAMKVFVDGTKCDTYAKLAAAIRVDEIVSYRLNADGKLLEVDTAYDATNGGTTGKGTNENMNTLHKFKENYEGRWRKVPMSFSGQLYGDNSTKVFIIPTDTTQTEYFRVADMSYFGENSVHTVTGYKNDANSFVADIIVKNVTDAGASDVQEYSRVYFVNKKREVYLEDLEENVYEIEYVKGNDYAKIYTKPQANTTAASLNVGDGVVFVEDMDGYATYIERMYDRENNTAVTKSALSSWNTGDRHIVGTVLKKLGNLFTLSTPSEVSGEIFNGATAETQITVYDSDEKMVYPGTIADILDTTTGTASNVFMRMYYGIPRSILVIK